MKATIDIPKLLRRRPTVGGYIVPYFVAWFLDDEQVEERTPGAKPDFRVIDMRRATICRKRNVCWICGKQMGGFRWFVFGPGSAIGRSSVEPPSHRECAHYAVRVCPYMLSSTAQHRPITGLRPTEHILDIEDKHPGVVVLWATKSYQLIPVDPSKGVYYYYPGEPNVVEFWREGRKATRAEITAAIDLVFVRNPKADRADRDMAWRIEHLMRFAPAEDAP